ncbi:MAG: sulfotransferase [Pseudomonadota bacterium]
MPERDSLHRDALAALNRGAYPEAAQLCQSLLQNHPDFADGWFLMAMVAAANLRIPKALELIDNALKLDPNNAEYWCQQAKLLAMTQRNAAARQAAERAQAIGGLDALGWDTLGVVFSKLGDFGPSAAALQHAVALRPDNAQFHFNLASSQQFLGKAEAARTHYEAALATRPDFYRAHWALAELEKTAPNADRLAHLEGLQGHDNLKADDKLYLGHALYYQYEQAGAYDRAFDALLYAKRERIGQIGYAIAQDERLFDAVAHQLPDANPDQTAGGGCLFVVGMPRSGTTLVERILDSHPEVRSLGERQDFGLAVKAASGTTSRLVLDEDVLQAACARGANHIARHVHGRLQHDLMPGQYLVDKTPLNFLYLGLVLRTLPAARVVVVRRHPLDTIFSNFRQLFAINFSYYNYSYEIGDTAGYYALFDKLMQHWRALFPEQYHEVVYEDLVADAEPVTRRLLEHMGLDWDPACLKFHENTSAVSTASTMQVRQPLYRSALARWQHYDKHLDDARTILTRQGVAF